MVKSTYCSTTKTGVQIPALTSDDAKMHITPAPKDPISYSCLCRHFCVEVHTTHTHTQFFKEKNVTLWQASKGGINKTKGYLSFKGRNTHVSCELHYKRGMMLRKEHEAE